MTRKTYDIVLSSPFSNYDFFAHKMRELCGQMDLTFFLADDVWVHEFLGKLRTREIAVRAMLDLTANQTDPTDVYTRLAYEVKEQGGVVIDDPEQTAFAAHKANLHDLLVQNRVLVPETIVVRSQDVDKFRITKEVKSKVGSPFVVKPAWGDSGVGVIVDATSEYDLKMSQAQAPNSDSFPDPTTAQAETAGRAHRLVPPVPHLPGGHPVLVESRDPRVPDGVPGADQALQAAAAAAHHAQNRPGLSHEEVQQ